MGHDNSSSKAKAMEITLRTIGGGIHAVFYKGGTQIGEQNLGDEVVVREASAEEMADRPATTPEVAESKDTQNISHLHRVLRRSRLRLGGNLRGKGLVMTRDYPMGLVAKTGHGP